jgi:hypothetical protein
LPALSRTEAARERAQRVLLLATPVEASREAERAAGERGVAVVRMTFRTWFFSGATKPKVMVVLRKVEKTAGGWKSVQKQDRHGRG